MDTKKLVPQDPNDEPASLLLQRIHEEKERLIKEGKIKRSKTIATDEEIEAPFEIPESWEWTRLINVVNDIADIDHKMPPVSDSGVPYISPLNFGDDGSIDYDNAKKISEEDFKQLSKKCKPEKGDFIFPRYGTIGVIRKVETDINFLVSYSCATIKPHLESVHPDYILYVLNSPLIQDVEIKKYVRNTTQSNIGLQSIKLFLFPLPPLAEQQRIVNEVERWFAVIDALESNEGDLLKAIDQAKSKILDLAIHGKLVPQDPNDEPAIELLKRINPKFEACDNEDCPFEIPTSWEWTTLGVISNYGNTTNIEINNIPQDAWVLELEDLEKDSAIVLKRVTKRDREIKGVRHSFKNGDVLYSKLRTYLNKVLVAPEDGYCTTEIIPISFQPSIHSAYINHVLRSRYFLDYTIQCGYGVKMPRLSTADARKGLIPLPPYQEQLRIVAKIEELFGVLDGIKEALEA